MPVAKEIHVYRVTYFLMILIIIGQGWYTLQTLNHNHDEAVRGREALLRMGERTEMQTLDFMTRTVDRWDKLARDNPSLVVPRVVEPLDSPHLEDHDMQRLPTPTP